MLQELIAHADSEVESRPQRFEAVRQHLLMMRLRSWCEQLGVAGMYLRAACFSRFNDEERAWLQVGQDQDTAELDKLVQHLPPESLQKVPLPLYEKGPILWFVPLRREPSPKRLAHRSVLLVLVPNKSVASKIEAAVLRCAEEFELCLRCLRQWADHVAKSAMSQCLNQTRGHDNTLKELAHILGEHTRSDGVKIYLLRKHCEGPVVSVQAWDREQNEHSDQYPLDQTTGMADWVLNNGRWLLIDQPCGPKPDQKSQVLGLTAGPDQMLEAVQIEARRDRKGITQDCESTLLLYPLTMNDRVIGVVSIWRLGDWQQYPDGPALEPYDHLLDLPFLKHVTSVIAATTHWRVQRQIMRQKSEAIARLSKQMLTTEDPAKIHACVAEEAARLIGCKRSLLLLRDQDAFISVADWTHDAVDQRSKPRWFFTIHKKGKRNKATSGLRRHPDILEFSGKRLRFARKHRIIEFRSPLTDEAEGVLIPLFNKQVSANLNDQTVDAPFLLDTVKDFLQEASVFLKHYHQLYVDHFVKRFNETEDLSEQDPKQVLIQAAKFLRQCTQCDAVLVYRPTSEGLCITEVEPERLSMQGYAVPPDSLTAEAVSSLQTLRVRDVEDASDPQQHRMNLTLLKKVAERLGWQGVRSWMCFPVVINHKVVGVLKLLTRQGGAYLASWHEEMVHGIAHSASRQMEQLTQELVQHQLNEITSRLAAMVEPELSRAMTEQLTQWCQSVFSPNAGFAIFASVNATMIKRFAASAHLEQALLNHLEASSVESTQSLQVQDHYVHAQRIDVTGSALEGSFFFVKETPFTVGEQAYIAEATREMSVLLEKERNRHAIRREMSMFRHALIGPVLGLTNAAGELYDLVEAQGLDPAAEGYMANVEREAEAISLWQRNQRLYLSDEIDPIFRDYSLRKLFRQGKDRFEASFRKRGIKFLSKWMPKDNLVLRLDPDGMDLVFSNLLDNALKYGFYNRYVELGVSVKGPWVKVWVENIGHPIPPELMANIFKPGERMDWNDPIRPIHGTGLGLPMSQKVVKAHGGFIQCESHLAAKEPSGPDNIAPHRVRFTLQIPLKRMES